MDEMNCVGIHCFAEAHSCKVLEKRSMDYILEHFSSVYQQVRYFSNLRRLCKYSNKMSISIWASQTF